MLAALSAAFLAARGNAAPADGISYLLDPRDIQRAGEQYERDMERLERAARERIRAALNPVHFNAEADIPELRFDPSKFRYARFVRLAATGAGVQRTELKIDPRWRGGCCVLLFRTPTYRTTVRLNGVQVYEHVGDSPFEVDITRWLKWDDGNQLEIACVDHRGRPARSRRPKLMLIRSAVHIRRVLITPSVRRQQLTVDVTIGTATGSSRPGDWRVKCVVTDLRFGQAYAAAMARVGSPSQAVRLTIPASKLRLWSPAEPHLYILRCVLVDAGGEIRDILDSRFGYREFEVRGSCFFLNGEPIFLHGSYPSAMMPPKVVRKVIDSDDRALRKEWLKWVWHCVNAYKAAHLNTFYMNPDVTPYSDELLDVFDEAGMLVLAFPFAPYANYRERSWDLERAPVPLKQFQRQAMELFVRDWNHPCVVIYAFDGEGMDCYLREGDLEAYRRAQRYFREFMRFVIRSNPTRVHSDSCGDRNFTGLSQVYDEHFYAGYYHSSVPDFVNRCIPRHYFGHESRGRAIPVIFSEMCGCYTSGGREGAFTNEPVVSSWVGVFANDPQVARTYQAWNYKHTIEGCRRLQVDGIFPFAYCVGFYGPRGTYSDPAPAALCVRIAMSPVLVSFGTFDQRVYRGDACVLPVWVVNDTKAHIRNAHLQWAIEREGTGIVAHGEKKLDIAPYSSECVLRIDWRVPKDEPVGQHVARARLINESGKVLSFNSHPFLVYGRERASIEQHGAKVLLYDPSGDTEAVLHRLGVKFDRYIGGKVREADLLIVGANAADYMSEDLARDVRDFAERDGGVVLVLEQDRVDHLRWLSHARRNIFATSCGIIPENAGYHRYNFAHIVRRGHPIFNGLGEWDFNLWNGFNGTIHAGDGMLNCIDLCKEGWKVLAATCTESGACLAEKVGWIYSQFLAVKRFSKDPIATRYLCNLLNYAITRARGKRRWLLSTRAAMKWLERTGQPTGDHPNIELDISDRLFWYVPKRGNWGAHKYRGVAFKFKKPIREIRFSYWIVTTQRRLRLQVIGDDGRIIWQSDRDVTVETVKLDHLNLTGFELRACHTKAILYPSFFAEVWNLQVSQ